MCLILIAYDIHPDYSLILAANRDEYYRRPTLPLDYWEDEPDILAGRDLEARGTWLGITRSGRFGALTNFRGTTPPDRNAPSRGALVSDFLRGKMPPEAYLEQVKTIGYRFNGFNLLVGDREYLGYYSNKDLEIHQLKADVYGISTCLLGTSWPKINKGIEGLSSLISPEREMELEDFFKLLEDRSCPPDDQLPQTDFDRQRERLFAPLFIESEGYGTRSSSVLWIRKTGEVTFAERTFVPLKRPVEYKTRRFELVLS